MINNVEAINEEAHTADLSCPQAECAYAAEGVDLLTAENVTFSNPPGITVNGNVSVSVENKAALPDPGEDGTVAHVMSDESGRELFGTFAPDLYVVVEGVWKKLHASIIVRCPTCSMAATFPMSDPKNSVGAALGRVKTS